MTEREAVAIMMSQLRPIIRRRALTLDDVEKAVGWGVKRIFEVPHPAELLSTDASEDEIRQAVRGHS